MKADKYDDIINFQHPTSKKHPRMERIDRAAQFAPFSALTGYEDEVKETARLTEDKIEISEGVIERMNMKLQILSALPEAEITVVYFKPDDKKTGGKYITLSGILKSIDNYERIMVIGDEKIPIDMISDIDGEIFKEI